MYPQQGEQAINSKVFEKLGLGKIIRKERRLMEAVISLIDEFQPNQELQEKFSNVRLDELVDRIEKYINDGV